MSRSRRLLRVALALGLLVGLPAGPAAARQEIGEFPQENAWWRLTPSVIWEGETLTIEVTIVGRDDVARVSVYNLESPETTDPIVAPGAGDFVTHYSAELYDDGTRGDRVAGDRIFTREGLTPADVFWEGRNSAYGRFQGLVRVQYADGSFAQSNSPMFGGVVAGAYRDAFGVHDFGGGLSATSYAFFIEDADYEVIDAYPLASVFCGTSNFAAYRKLYSVLPDVFDFATVMPGMQVLHPEGFGENVPYFVGVSSAVEGIGTDPFDKTATFGSAGRLQGAIYHSFGDVSIMDHEIVHAWGADLGESLGLVDDDGTHWSEWTDIGGQLGAYHFTDDGRIGSFHYNGDETWRFVANTDHSEDGYAPLELYLMGLIPADEVPPIHILRNPDLTDPERVTVESFTTVTIGDIIAAEGERSPAYPDAQTEFTMAFIVTQDVAFNDAAYAFFSLLSYDLTAPDRFPEADYFAPFSWATGGAATLDTRLPVDLPLPDLAAMTTTTVTTVATPPGTVPPTVSSGTTQVVAATTTTPAPSQGTDDGSGVPLVVLVAVGVLAAATGFWFVTRKQP